ncbi:E3 ubiquitin-protein ligase [Acrasis kona]|uniref:RING-type E3 ubiquitin transferase n=1 Tax=Acrasis kona TaxID=1008807 RepID=A0AAW2ZL01_9EUKA
MGQNTPEEDLTANNSSSILDELTSENFGSTLNIKRLSGEFDQVIADTAMTEYDDTLPVRSEDAGPISNDEREEDKEKKKRIIEGRQKFPELFTELIDDQEDEKNLCSICLELYTTDNPAIDCDCSHQFHLQCVEEWLQRSPNCPVCWQKLKHPFMEDFIPVRSHSSSFSVQPTYHQSMSSHPIQQRQVYPIGMNQTVRRRTVSGTVPPTSPTSRQGLLGRIFNKIFVRSPSNLNNSLI